MASIKKTLRHKLDMMFNSLFPEEIENSRYLHDFSPKKTDVKWMRNNIMVGDDESDDDSP